MTTSAVIQYDTVSHLATMVTQVDGVNIANISYDHHTDKITGPSIATGTAITFDNFKLGIENMLLFIKGTDQLCGSSFINNLSLFSNFKKSDLGISSTTKIESHVEQKSNGKFEARFVIDTFSSSLKFDADGINGTISRDSIDITSAQLTYFMRHLIHVLWFMGGTTNI